MRGADKRASRTDGPGGLWRGDVDKRRPGPGEHPPPPLGRERLLCGHQPFGERGAVLPGRRHPADPAVGVLFGERGHQEHRQHAYRQRQGRGRQQPFHEDLCPRGDGRGGELQGPGQGPRAASDGEEGHVPEAGERDGGVPPGGDHLLGGDIPDDILRGEEHLPVPPPYRRHPF